MLSVGTTEGTTRMVVVEEMTGAVPVGEWSHIQRVTPLGSV